MHNDSPEETPFRQLLSRLPPDAARQIQQQLHSVINYEPRIGLMGKTGSGKSSLCNTLFNPPPASVDAVKGCTRRLQRWQVQHGSRMLHIVDFPGIAESPELDALYQRLYLAWSSRLDVIVWVLKADERAWNDDLRCYRSLREAGIAPSRFLFVLSQADKIEPCREWDTVSHCPSPRQAENLHAKAVLAATQFATAHPVIAVSAAEHYNLHRWAEALILALPPHSCSAVSRHLAPELRTGCVSDTARAGFVRITGDIFDEAVNTLALSDVLIRQLRQLRHALLCAARALWHLLFWR